MKHNSAHRTRDSAHKTCLLGIDDGGVKYNALNSTFKIALEKGLDSEDADRRDSMNRFRPRSLC